MKIKSTVKSDMRDITNFFKKLDKITSLEAEAGYYDEDRHHSGYSMYEIAWLHENGELDFGIPQRPFMTQASNITYRNFKVDNKWKRSVVNYLFNKGVIKVNKVFKDMADNIKRDIQQAIDEQNFWPNNPEWARVKAAKNPKAKILVETGEMYEGVKTKVVKKNEE